MADADPDEAARRREELKMKLKRTTQLALM
jgi:hypothetical protein